MRAALRATGLAAVAAAALATTACSAAGAGACLGQLKPPAEVRGSLGAFVPCNFQAPACGENDPAYQAVPGAQLVFTSTDCGTRTFAIRTGGDGTYAVVLPEGHYNVAVEGGRPASVSVVSGQRVVLNLREDIGPARRFARVPNG